MSTHRRKRLRGIAAWLWDQPGQPGILILGRGGVGKTTLGKILGGKYDWLWDAPGAYDALKNWETEQ